MDDIEDGLPRWHDPHGIVLVKEPVKVEIDWIGEGYDCDYDPADPDDRPLYRFDVYVRPSSPEPGDDEWDEVPDSSYCTYLDTSLPREALEEFARMIMDEVHDPVSSGQSVKRLCEDLAQTSMSYFEPIIAAARAARMQEDTPALPPADRAGPRM